jgi:hypothetical protein
MTPGSHSWIGSKTFHGGQDGAPVNDSLLPIDRPEDWPEPLRRFLTEHHDLFLDWATGPTWVGAAAYDRAIYQLMDLLQPYDLRAWHCTRLTDQEAQAILAQGMQPPNPAILSTRIDAVVADGRVSAEIAREWKARNQVHETYRRDRIWWCFYPPRESGEGGISALLGNWGGEALYNTHESDPVTGPPLRRIGTPSLVEADIPVALLENSPSAAFSVVAHFLKASGHTKRDHLQLEDRIRENLPPAQIRRVLQHPEPDFIALTGCDTWDSPIEGAPRNRSSR